jgi:hypothetical protein
LKSFYRSIADISCSQENGELEIHIPRPFTADRPAICYTHQTIPMNIEDHQLAKAFPKATKSASVQPGPQGFREFAAREGAPETLEDFLFSDAPQISLHITSFNNETLVALSWPHTLMDVMGQQALLRGWSLVLANRDAEVPPMLGAREDAICAAAEAPVKYQEVFKVGQRQLKGWDMLMFGLRFAWDMMWNRVVETRTIFLPRDVIAELRSQAQADLAIQDDGEGKPFISEGDVLTAWATRAIASSLPQPRPVTVLHALNTRFRLPSLSQASGVFVQNMAVAAFTFLSADTAVGPLGQIALENRNHLQEQSTEAQVLAFLRELKTDSKSGGDPTLLCGESDALLIPFTNWTRADLFKTADFSPAVVPAGAIDKSRTNAPGTMVYHHADSMRPNAASRNVVVVLGKDHNENYWVTGLLLPQAWSKIEEALKILP